MPYVAEANRAHLDTEIEALLAQLKRVPDNKVDGDLNYTISRLVAGTLGKAGWRYHLQARAIAVFEAAKLEFYRRVVGPYEDQAIAKNGDIPEFQ